MTPPLPPLGPAPFGLIIVFAMFLTIGNLLWLFLLIEYIGKGGWK